MESSAVLDQAVSLTRGSAQVISWERSPVQASVDSQEVAHHFGQTIVHWTMFLEGLFLLP